MANQTKEWGGVIISPCCKNNCFFCYPNKKIDKGSLDKEKLNVLRNLIEFKKKGIKKIEISGCDPIEYPYIVDIVGNTICADLLDYLERDMLFTGMKERSGDRVINYISVVNVCLIDP